MSRALVTQQSSKLRLSCRLAVTSWTQLWGSLLRELFSPLVDLWWVFQLVWLFCFLFSRIFKALPQCLVMQGDQNNARWTQISSRVTNQARTKQSWYRPQNNNTSSGRQSLELPYLGRLWFASCLQNPLWHCLLLQVLPWSYVLHNIVFEVVASLWFCKSLIGSSS